jgi:hypothetical protein
MQTAHFRGNTRFHERPLTIILRLRHPYVRREPSNRQFRLPRLEVLRLGRVVVEESAPIGSAPSQIHWILRSNTDRPA